jgi:hypothetical protein
MLLEGGLHALGHLPNQIRLGGPVAVRTFAALSIALNFVHEVGFSDAPMAQLLRLQLFYFLLI